MKKYYKGLLFDGNNINNLELFVDMANGKILEKDNSFYHKFELLNDNEKNILDYYFKTGIINNEVKNILIKMFKDDLLNYSKVFNQIIFEVIEDNENNLYGKEILTGNIFPIAKEFDINCNLDIYNTCKCFIHEEGRNAIIFKKEDKHVSKYFYDEKDILYSYYTIDDNYIINSVIKENGHYKSIKLGVFIKSNEQNIKLTISPTIAFSNLARAEVFIDNQGIANTEEINLYKLKYQDRIFNRKKRKGFIENLNNLSDKNVFKGEIIIKKDEKTNLKKDELTKIMEQVEFMLMKLKNYNEKEYIKCKNEYDALINPSSNDLKLTINKVVLESLLARITLSFKFDKTTGDNILDYLESKKNEYLENMINGNIKTNLTISEIDKIMELYLKMQNDFDVINKRKIIRNITLLYLLELIENKDNYDEISLQNSYINDNLLTLIIWINTLKELDIIEIDSLFDLSINYNLQDILEIVKNIKINNIDRDKIKKLV